MFFILLTFTNFLLKFNSVKMNFMLTLVSIVYIFWQRNAVLIIVLFRDLANVQHSWVLSNDKVILSLPTFIVQLFQQCGISTFTIGSTLTFVATLNNLLI